MSSPFAGIDIAGSALRAFQQALNVTGDNISNVNTPGYSRQTVNLVGTDPTTIYSDGKQLMIGTGVTIQSVDRIRDMFLEGNMSAATSEQSRLNTLTTNLGSVQTVIPASSDSGISNALDTFFNAWSALASDPNESANYSAVQSAGQQLANQVQGTYLDLKSLNDQSTSDIASTFNQVDQLTQQIADLNTQIRQDSADGSTPNGLLDTRDQAIQNLSQLVNVTTHQFTDGTMAVYMGQDTLVDSAGSHAIPRTYNTANQTVTDGTFTYQVTGGNLAGLFQSINTISGYQSQLDTLANNLRTQVNQLETGGMTNETPPGAGVDFFNDVPAGQPQTGAIDFDLSAQVKADANMISAGTTGSAGDGGLALSISQLQNSQIPGLGNQTFGQYYQNFAAKIGTDIQSYTTQQDSQNAVVSQINSQIQSNSGVSLDDEMSSMLRYQRSYEAAAKSLTIFDQVTSDLIAMMQS